LLQKECSKKELKGLLDEIFGVDEINRNLAQLIMEIENKLEK